MMGYQFFHIESYARVAGKDKAGGNNLRSVLAEAMRETGSCPHVAMPNEPKIIFGDIGKVEEEANFWAENSQDAIGRKLRKDGHCLLAGVFSAPDDLNNEDWEAYKADSLIWLQNRFGDRLRCVLEHNDEAHRHCHFYCVPKLGERFEVLHDGKAAALAAKQEGKKKGEQNKAYCEAMRKLQNDYWSVSKRFKLTRLGPGKRRLTRAQWKAEQEQLRVITLVKEEAKKEQIKALEQKQLWNKATAECKKERSELKKDLEKIEESKLFWASLGDKAGSFIGSAKLSFWVAVEKIKFLINGKKLTKQLDEEKKRVADLEYDVKLKSEYEIKLKNKLMVKNQELDRQKEKTEVVKDLLYESRDLIDKIVAEKRAKLPKKKSLEI